MDGAAQWACGVLELDEYREMVDSGEHAQLNLRAARPPRGSQILGLAHELGAFPITDGEQGGPGAAGLERDGAQARDLAAVDTQSVVEEAEPDWLEIVDAADRAGPRDHLGGQIGVEGRPVGRRHHGG